jgi:hypothetical protein
LFDGSRNPGTRQASKIERERDPVGRHVSHEEEGRVRLAPEDHLGVVSDEVDLNGGVVERHYHSRLGSEPVQHVRDHRLVDRRQRHLVLAKRRRHALRQVLVHVPGEVVEETHPSAEVRGVSGNGGARVVGREGRQLSLGVGEFVVTAVGCPADPSGVVEQDSDGLV